MTRFEEHRNCWKAEKIPRGSVFIDAQDYYRNLYENLQRAERSVFILGWEFHHQTRLLHESPAPGAPPERLDRFLRHICRAKPDLKIYILCWDFPSFFLVEREIFQDLKFRWKTSKQVRFVFDDRHPIGGSHHQKLVVIDDALAYCGGLDLTCNRWDTREHRPADPGRINPWKKPYAPMHDLQLSLTGPLARSLGDLARERWRRATGERIAPARGVAGGDRFVFGGFEFRNQRAALARTLPAFKDRPAVKEIETLLMELIESAERSIYLEMQFLTSVSITQKLLEASRRRRPPEIVLILPQKYLAAWERNMMGLLQNRMIHRLRKGGNSVKIFFPDDARYSGEHFQVHSKLMVVDDRRIFMGSANFTNRSMALDSECNILLEDAPDLAPRLVRSLLGEYTGQPEAVVERLAKRERSLVPLIAALNGRAKDKQLVPYEDVPEPTGLGQLLSRAEITEMADPEKPFLPEQVADRLSFAEKGRKKSLLRRVAGGGLHAALKIGYASVSAGMLLLIALPMGIRRLSR